MRKAVLNFFFTIFLGYNLFGTFGSFDWHLEHIEVNYGLLSTNGITYLRQSMLIHFSLLFFFCTNLFYHRIVVWPHLLILNVSCVLFGRMVLRQNNSLSI